jgi:predicted RNase H-like HicB family nuclease
MALTLTGTAYSAEVERDASGDWIGTVGSLRGVHTHARSLASLRSYLQDAIALWLEVEQHDAGNQNPHVDRGGITVELRVKLPPEVRRATDDAQRRRKQARSAEIEAAVATRRAAQALADAGLSRRDAAEVLGLSHQRVDQLLRSG